MLTATDLTYAAPVFTPQEEADILATTPGVQSMDEYVSMMLPWWNPVLHLSLADLEMDSLVYDKAESEIRIPLRQNHTLVACCELDADDQPVGIGDICDAYGQPIFRTHMTDQCHTDTMSFLRSWLQK